MAEKKAKVEETKTEEVANTKQSVKRYVYVGPTNLKGQYKAGKICKGMPELKYFEEKPQLKNLFVETSELSEAKIDLQNRTSALSIIYAEVQKWAVEGGK